MPLRKQEDRNLPGKKRTNQKKARDASKHVETRPQMASRQQTDSARHRLFKSKGEKERLRVTGSVIHRLLLSHRP